MTAAADAAPVEADGRRARSDRTRRAVLDALLELLEAGRLPTTAEVAARAGISERSLFRHFDSRDGLYDAVVDDLTRRVAPIAASARLEGSLDERLGSLLSSRADLYEAITPMRRAAPAYAARSAHVEASMLESQRVLRGQVGAVRAAELAPLPPDARGEVLDGLDAVLSWESWDHLRRLGASKARAQRVVGASVRAVLASIGPSSG